MRPCTSTNIHEALGPEAYHFTTFDSMRACHEAGFRVLDLNLNVPALEGCPLADDRNWRMWVAEVDRLREELSLEFSSAHAVFCVYDELTDRREQLICRSVEAAGMLGIPWLVVHPFSVRDAAWYSHRGSVKVNLEHMKRYADIASRFNTGIAIENMVEDQSSRRYGSCAEDLLELLDLLEDPTFGVCWDFGHGGRSNCDTAASLRQIGDKLKVVHVHDWKWNKPHHDHTLPYLGFTEWKEILQVLKEIGFKGDWNLECHEFTKNLPPEVRKTALSLAFEICNYMTQL